MEARLRELVLVAVGVFAAAVPSFAQDGTARGIPADSHLVGLERRDDRTARAVVGGSRDGIVIELMIDLTLELGAWHIVSVGE